MNETAPTAEIPAPRQAPPVVKPQADSKLEQLVAMYEHVAAKAKDYAQQLDGLKAQIKVEMVLAAPGHNTIRLESEHLSKPYRLTAKTQRRLDTKSLKAAEPDVWDRYAKESTSWYFEAAK